MSFKYQKAQNNFPSISETSVITTPHWEFTQSGLTGLSKHYREAYRVWVSRASARLWTTHLSLCMSAYLAKWRSRGWWGPACPVCGLLSLVRCSSRGSPGPARTSTDAAWSSFLAPPATASLRINMHRNIYSNIYVDDPHKQTFIFKYLTSSNVFYVLISICKYSLQWTI